MDSVERFETAIIGAGLAGASVLAELAARTPPAFRALIFGATAPGPGTAYATGSNRLYMNGTATAMSANPADRNDLVRWLGGETGDALITRRHYGRYLTERSRAALAARPGFRAVAARAVALYPQGSGFTILDRNGIARHAERVVLALGNFPPSDAFLPPALRAFGGFVADPWRFDGRLPAGDALIVGSGLTAMDALALLEGRGRRTIHVLSRHGLIPAIENPRARALDPATLALRDDSPHALLHSLRRAAREWSAAGGDWREVVEAIRRGTPAIWAGWSERDRRRFLRHLHAFWAIHRYRVPPETADAHRRLAAAGRIVHHRGRVADAAPATAGHLEVVIANADGRTPLRVAGIVNCTGPNGDYRRVNDPLVRQLVASGIVRPDGLRLGIDATADLHPLSARGTVDPHLYALGPPLRGMFFESTAVPETVAQAAAIATAIAAEYTAGALSAAS